MHITHYTFFLPIGKLKNKKGFTKDMKDEQKKYCGDKEIGERVKYWRNVRKLSQAKLAEKIAVSQSVICRLERGEDMTSVDRLHAIAKALQVPLSVLFGEADGVFDTEQVALLWKISQYKPEQKQMLIQYLEKNIELIIFEE